MISSKVVPSGEYAGCLLVTQHRYFIGGGSYDWYYLVRSNGKRLGAVGEAIDHFWTINVGPQSSIPVQSNQ